MKKIILIIVMLCLMGCVPERTDEDVKRGELRHELFVECMELAAKLPREQDDDVHKIISGCSSYAYYTSNSMSK